MHKNELLTLIIIFLIKSLDGLCSLLHVCICTVQLTDHIYDTGYVGDLIINH